MEFLDFQVMVNTKTGKAVAVFPANHDGTPADPIKGYLVVAAKTPEEATDRAEYMFMAEVMEWQ